MKSWHFIAPDWASLDTVWRSSKPFVLWPVCEKPLLAYWLDEAVRQGIQSVSIEALDRPHVIRHWLDQWDLWSRSIEVYSRQGEGIGKECFHLNRLPNSPNMQPVQTSGELLDRWFELQIESLNRRASETIHLDYEFSPGVWLGPGVSVAENITFVAPCWVGGYTKIGSGCRLGPHAFIGAGSFLDQEAEVIESIVCADTFVGSHITLQNMVAQGGLLIDLKRGISVEVKESFVLSSLEVDSSKPQWFERVIASLLAPILEGIARLINRGAHSVSKYVILKNSITLNLITYSSGPLCIRRASWMHQVSEGKIRFFGVLPRDQDDWDHLSPEAQFIIEKAPIGVFSLSDLYDCHSAKQPDEWMHALYQASNINGTGQRLGVGSWLKIIFRIPLES